MPMKLRQGDFVNSEYPYPNPDSESLKAWLGDAVLTLAARNYYCAYPQPNYPVSAILSNRLLRAYARHAGIAKEATAYEAYVWDRFLEGGIWKVMEEVKNLVKFRSSDKAFNL